MNDVVVTGIGMVSPFGDTAASSYAAWISGRKSSRTFLPELTGTPLADFPVALPPQFDIAARLDRHKRMVKYMSGAALIGCVAAHEAVAMARLAGRITPDRIGLYAATGLAAADVNEIRRLLEESVDEQGTFSCRLFGAQGLPATNPLLSFKILANVPACMISIIECIRGPNLIFTPWEADGAAALLEAWKAVATGEVDAAVTGAADTPAHPATLAYLCQSGRLESREYPASAAAYLVLERADRVSAASSARLSRADVEKVSSQSSLMALAERLGRCFAAAPAVALAFDFMGRAGRRTIA